MQSITFSIILIFQLQWIMSSPNKAKCHPSMSIMFYVSLDKKWTHRSVWTHQGFLSFRSSVCTCVLGQKGEQSMWKQSELCPKPLLTAGKKQWQVFRFLVTDHMCRLQIIVPWCKPKIAHSTWLPYVVSGFQKPSQMKGITKCQSPLNYSMTLKCCL